MTTQKGLVNWHLWHAERRRERVREMSCALGRRASDNHPNSPQEAAPVATNNSDSIANWIDGSIWMEAPNVHWQKQGESVSKRRRHLRGHQWAPWKKSKRKCLWARKAQVHAAVRTHLLRRAIIGCLRAWRGMQQPSVIIVSLVFGALWFSGGFALTQGRGARRFVLRLHVEILRLCWLAFFKLCQPSDLDVTWPKRTWSLFFALCSAARPVSTS